MEEDEKEEVLGEVRTNTLCIEGTLHGNLV